ncbi:uncharacterized protein LOC108950611 [Ciona intestinalis]
MCSICSSDCVVDYKCNGTWLTVDQKCMKIDCGNSRTGTSQQSYNEWKQPLNILLPGLILAAGISATKLIRAFKAVNITWISESTYYKSVNSNAYPAVFQLWKDEKKDIIKTMTTRRQPLIIGGDMRADTPGHCAKFGTYSFLELNINKIISTQLLQSNEVGNSNAMEKQGFIRCLEDLQQYDLRPHTVITDRHLQIAKYIREEQNDIVHHYDIWHLTKG